LLMRRFRSGQTHGLILRRQRKQLGGSLLAIPKLGWSIAAAAFTAPCPSRALHHLARSALHAGVIAAAVRVAPYVEYRPAHAKD
jgi:hypothetical protein